MNDVPNASLLERWDPRDPQRVSEARRALMPSLERICRSILGDGPVAQEVAEDVWTDFLMEHADEVLHPSALPRYLHLMAVRRARRVQELRRRLLPLEGDPGPPEDPPEVAALLAEDERERQRRLARCMSQLTTKCRKVLRLRFHHGRTQEAIGEVFGITKQHAGRILAKALATLRRCMEVEHEGRG